MIAVVVSTPKYRPSRESAELPVHEKDFVLGDQAATLPFRQRTAVAVALTRLTGRDVVDGNGQSDLQTVCPGSARTRFNMGTPRGR